MIRKITWAGWGCKCSTEPHQLIGVRNMAWSISMELAEDFRSHFGSHSSAGKEHFQILINVPQAPYHAVSSVSPLRYLPRKVPPQTCTLALQNNTPSFLFNEEPHGLRSGEASPSHPAAAPQKPPNLRPAPSFSPCSSTHPDSSQILIQHLPDAQTAEEIARSRLQHHGQIAPLFSYIAVIRRSEECPSRVYSPLQEHAVDASDVTYEGVGGALGEGRW